MAVMQNAEIMTKMYDDRTSIFARQLTIGPGVPSKPLKPGSPWKPGKP